MYLMYTYIYNASVCPVNNHSDLSRTDNNRSLRSLIQIRRSLSLDDGCLILISVLSF